MTNIVFSAMLLTSVPIKETQGLLYPFESETREVRSLDGKWNFLKGDPFAPNKGIDEKWYEKNLSDVGDTIIMPVPASYNDITQDASLRDHVGTVWYDRTFFVPKSWKDDGIVWIRFGSVHYAAIVVSNRRRLNSNVKLIFIFFTFSGLTELKQLTIKSATYHLKPISHI